ncbi:hypothetical protein [Candidatus Phytoplasma meliae]|uniref:J domain-containing protein n=1 Tax=Candidatus Phytoplasma meliae TaxID=1848402 RepID=A0ABS5CXT3_9MOLU|nr:hypothetical protein [Candidatus Phytoplasma meliae]MBP5835787.1 hypothetical protein [Candidatus Phytoplasma meliae]MBP5836202.1 hypothetical protein [Candidatus Phytoplasma meliae]
MKLIKTNTDVKRSKFNTMKEVKKGSVSFVSPRQIPLSYFYQDINNFLCRKNKVLPQTLQDKIYTYYEIIFGDKSNDLFFKASMRSRANFFEKSLVKLKNILNLYGTLNRYLALKDFFITYLKKDGVIEFMSILRQGVSSCGVDCSIILEHCLVTPIIKAIGTKPTEPSNELNQILKYLNLNMKELTNIQLSDLIKITKKAMVARHPDRLGNNSRVKEFMQLHNFYRMISDADFKLTNDSIQSFSEADFASDDYTDYFYNFSTAEESSQFNQQQTH